MRQLLLHLLHHLRVFFKLGALFGDLLCRSAVDEPLVVQHAVGTFQLAGETFLFFLQAVGTLMGTKNAGVTLTFLMQSAGLFLTILFLFRAKLAADPAEKVNAVSFLPLLCGIAVFCKLMEGGNLCEEWSLPAIAFSLFLMVKYAANVEDQPLHPLRYAFLHGIAPPCNDSVIL